MYKVIFHYGNLLILHIIQIVLCAAKPNHKLNYTVGTDFCLEDTSFPFVIICYLEDEPVPPPKFQWKITLNETDIIIGDIEVNGTYFDNDTLIFSGNAITELDQYSILRVTCIASNSFGSDTGNTNVKICGKCD